MFFLSYIFVYILPSYLYFVYFFHSIYIYIFYLYSSLFIMYFYMLCYVYIISYTFLFSYARPRASRGSVACVFRVVWKLFLQAYTSRLCTYMSASTARARSTRLQLSRAPSSTCVRVCDLCIVVLCVRRHASLQITYTLYSSRSAWRSRAVPSSLT